MIEYEIIWKCIHDLASGDEKNELTKWLQEDPLHEAYYNKIEKLYKTSAPLHHYGPEIEKSWKSFNEKVVNKKRNKLFIVVATIAASIVLGIVVFYPKLFQDHQDNQMAYKNDTGISVEPGGNKAILVLDDGREYDLSDSSAISLYEGNTEIKREGTAIKYTKNTLDKKNTNLLKYNMLKIPRGGEFFVVLSDSSKIWLNSETVLKYPVEFIEEERIVTLEGEAYFEVAHNDKPFKVITGEQVIEVLGTSFNISSYKEDSLTFTTLVEGKIIVFLKEDPDIKQVLLPNYQSYLYKSQKIISVREVDPFPYIAWKEGRFFFKNRPLSEILNTLSRWYDINFEFENDKIGGLKFTGDIKRYENLDNILSLIRETNEITYEFIDERMVKIR